MSLGSLLAVPLLAVVAAPRPVALGIYTHCDRGRYGASCDPTLQIAGDGTRVAAVTAFPRCSPVPLRRAPSARIRRGRFRYDATAVNVVGRKVRVAIAGHVLTRRSIRVSYRMSTAGCAQATRTVTLGFVEVGRPGAVG